LGIPTTDVQSEINDFNPGIYTTFGRFSPAASNDDWFHSELLLVWANNPVFSDIPLYHYLTEARYNGAEMALIGPDYSPSAIHADQYVPVRVGSDAALALAMCHTIIEENLANLDFVREQTDLGFLVQVDTGRYLRQSDLEEDGSDTRFYFYDEATHQISLAPLTLDLGDRVPALEGRYNAELADGSKVDVIPVFERLKQHLQQYTPEQASEICVTHPDTIRSLARKVASKRTHIISGWTLGKSYHGDLMERSICLLLGLTGNWGKQGAGIRSWAVGMFDGPALLQSKPRLGQDMTRQMIEFQAAAVEAVLEKNPDTTREILSAEASSAGEQFTGAYPAAFFWYHHCGYQQIWNDPRWQDSSMKRSFDDYFKDAQAQGWWGNIAEISAKTPPRILIEIGGNLLRRQRGGQRMLLENLWPKLDLIVSVDWRMSTTGLHSDIILPAAQHYEKVNFPYTTPDVMNLTLSDRVVEPAGESLSEWNITLKLAKKLAERAIARNFTEIEKADGTLARIDTLYEDITFGGELVDEDAVIDEMVRDSAVMGNIPADTTLESLRETGYVRFTNWGGSPLAMAQASDLLPDKTHSPFRWQTEKKEPFPTLTRRAQFYIDHEWFLEAGEELPVHKDAPAQGGDHPFVVTSGHPRWSVHSMNSANEMILGTNRGEPSVYINVNDAQDRNIKDGQKVRLYNDLATMKIEARVTGSVSPGQLVIYNGFEPYQHANWQDFSNLEPGLVKWLHLAGGYGHLQYRVIHWQPVPIDRAVRVDVEGCED
jgi:DMSO reductase family type II enzyme molybdopterin subunit